MPDPPRKRLLWPVVGFLLPNLLGFLLFTLFPVLFSFGMAFTNWTPKPAVKLSYLGLRNFTDLLGVRALDQPNPALASAYALFVIALVVGLIRLSGPTWPNGVEYGQGERFSRSWGLGCSGEACGKVEGRVFSFSAWQRCCAELRWCAARRAPGSPVQGPCQRSWWPEAPSVSLC